MADTSGWITIKHMVQELLLETGREQGYHKRFMHYVINGIRDLNLFHFDNVKTVKVTANDIGVISMPSDYVSFIALSISHGGIMWTLTRRDDLVRTTTLDNGEETLDSDVGEGVAIDKGVNRGYKTVGGKNDYYFTIEERKNRFIVRGIPTRTLFLQYISSGIDLEEGNDTQIPVKAKQSLKLWVMYQDALMNDKVNKNLVGIYENQYEKEVSKLDTLELPTADELRDMIYETYSNIRR